MIIIFSSNTEECEERKWKSWGIFGKILSDRLLWLSSNNFPFSMVHGYGTWNFQQLRATNTSWICIANAERVFLDVNHNERKSDGFSSLIHFSQCWGVCPDIAFEPQTNFLLSLCSVASLYHQSEFQRKQLELCTCIRRVEWSRNDSLVHLSFAQNFPIRQINTNFDEYSFFSILFSVEKLWRTLYIRLNFHSSYSNGETR